MGRAAQARQPGVPPHPTPSDGILADICDQLIQHLLGVEDATPMVFPGLCEGVQGHNLDGVACSCSICSNAYTLLPCISPWCLKRQALQDFRSVKVALLPPPVILLFNVLSQRLLTRETMLILIKAMDWTSMAWTAHPWLGHLWHLWLVLS